MLNRCGVPLPGGNWIDAPKSLGIKITGESLFNDGIGEVVFLTMLDIALGHVARVGSSA